MFLKHIQNENGVVLPLFAVMMVGVVVIASLSIDNGRGLLAHREANNLAEAVALAAVSTFDSSKSGWSNSGELARLIVEKSLINGVSDSSFETPIVSGNKITILEGGLEKIVINFERGFYGYSDGPDNPAVFTSLEGKDKMWNLPTSFFANAVKADVEVLNTKTPLADTAARLAAGNGFDSFKSIKGQAMAVKDSSIDVPVAPIAIPACELLSNLDVSSENRFASGGFANSGQMAGQLMNTCGREVVAREPGAREGNYSGNEQRFDGYIRADSYPRPPLALFTEGNSSLCYVDPVTGFHINCKAFPLNAVLGTPLQNGESPGIISGNQLADAFSKGKTGDLSSKIGVPFRPVSQDGSSFRDNISLENALNTYVNSGESTIAETFYAASGFATPNFPKRRNLVSTASPNYTDPFSETRLTWVGEFEEEVTQLGMLMKDAGDHHPSTSLSADPTDREYRYTNPLCHSGAVPHDSKNAPVKTVNVMLVTSTNPDTPYCDLGRTVTSTTGQKEISPHALTNPVVVGYIQAHVFDYRISKYQTQSGFLKPGVDLPAGLEDFNPFAFDSLFLSEDFQKELQDAKKFAENKEEFLLCESCKSNNFAIGECEDYGVPGDDPLLVTCPPPPDEAAISPFLSEESSFDWYNECFGNKKVLEDLLKSLAEKIPQATTVTSTPYNGTLPSCNQLCGGSFNTALFATPGLVEEYYEETGALPPAYYDVNSTCLSELGAIGSESYFGFSLEGVCGYDYSMTFKTSGCLITSPVCIPKPQFDFVPDISTFGCGNVCDGLSGTQKDSCLSYCSEAGGSEESEEESEEEESEEEIEEESEKELSKLEKYFENMKKIVEKIREEIKIRENLIEASKKEKFGKGSGSIINGIRAADDEIEDLIFSADGSKEDMVCLPRLLNDCYDTLDPSCWEQPLDRVSGWGCGGVRLRLSCGNFSLMTGNKSRSSIPGLVSKSVF